MTRSPATRLNHSAPSSHAASYAWLSGWKWEGVRRMVSTSCVSTLSQTISLFLMFYFILGELDLFLAPQFFPVWVILKPVFIESLDEKNNGLKVPVNSYQVVLMDLLLCLICTSLHRHYFHHLLNSNQSDLSPSCCSQLDNHDGNCFSWLFPEKKILGILPSTSRMALMTSTWDTPDSFL